MTNEEISLATILGHMRGMEARLIERMDARFAQVDARFERLENKMACMEANLSQQIENIDRRLDDIEVVQIPKIKKTVGMR